MLDTSMPMPALSLPLPPSARVSQSRPATRFLSAPQERLPRLSARKSLMSRSSKTVLKLSALLALSNLFSNLTLLLLLELTQRLDPLLLLPPTELLLLEPLLPVLLPLELPPLLLLVLLLLLQLLLDMLALDTVLLDMPDGNLILSPLFRRSHCFLSTIPC